MKYTRMQYNYLKVTFFNYVPKFAVTRYIFNIFFIDENVGDDWNIDQT